MQKALFLNKHNKINKLRLKIQNEKTRILKQDEQIKLPIRTFTLAPTHDDFFSKNKENSNQKRLKNSRQHVKFKLDRSKTINEVESDDKKQTQIRVKKLKQPKLKVRKSFSTSKMIKMPKTQHQLNQSTEQTQQQISQYSILIQIIQVLKNKFILFEYGMHNYSMKKDDFITFTYYVLSSFIFSQNSKSKNFTKLKYPQFSCLDDKIRKMERSIKEEMKQSLDILRLQSNIFKVQYNSHSFFEDQLTTSNKLMRMNEQILQISRQLNTLKEDKSQLLKMMKNIKTQLSEHLKQKVDIETHVYELKDIERQLKTQIQKKRILINSINQEAQNMFNYLNNNNCKIIERISTQYKQTQTQMRQYALYLQSNHMASQIGFEPRPFGQIQQVIVDQMKRINKTIIQDIEILPQLKEKLMRNFILRAMDKYKSKDAQMMKLNEFKTKCIRTYIENIKKWLENWTLKQQYLVNMRKQFIYDSQNLTQKIRNLKILQSGGFVQQANKYIDEIYDVCEKIIENYKLGNSFY